MIGTLVTEALQVVMTWTALVICQRMADRDRVASGVLDADAERAEAATDATE